ncbi:MAG: hypothetical protein U0271_02435 [Polyangiaceae bacterium]
MNPRPALLALALSNIALSNVACRPEPAREPPAGGGAVARSSAAPSVDPPVVQREAAVLAGYSQAPAWPGALRVEGVPAAYRVVVAGTYPCALTLLGELWCWDLPPSATGVTPENPLGQPTKLAEHVMSVDASADWVCGVLADGSVQCWQGTTSTVVEGISDGESIALSAYYACVNRGKKGLSCWMLSPSPTPEEKRPLDDLGLKGELANIDVRDSGGCGVTAHHELVCWQSSPYVGWAPGRAGEEPAPRKAEMLGVAPGSKDKSKRISDVIDFTTDGAQCILRASGVVLCWDNEDDPWLLAQNPLKPTAQIPEISQGAALFGALVLTRAGELWSIGFDQEGAPHAAPLSPQGLSSPIVAADGGSSRGCAVHADGAIDCWGFR